MLWNMQLANNKVLVWVLFPSFPAMRRTNRKSWPLLAILAYLASGTCFFRLYHSALDERETPIDFLRVVFSIAMFVHLGCLPNESRMAPRQAFQHQAARNRRSRKAQLRPPFQFYRLARKAAGELRVDADKYLSNILMLAENFTNSKEIINRESFQAALRQAMMKTKFTLVLGAKSLAKSLIKNHMVMQVENAPNSKLTILDVDMRKDPDKPLFLWIFERIENKCQSIQAYWEKGWAMMKAIKISLKAKIANVEVQAEASGDNDSPKQLLEEVIKKIDEKTGNATCILVDEANLALPGDDEAQAEKALQYFVMLTKQQRQACVVLISSEFAYPYRLQEAGMNLRDIENIIVINEIPKDEMVEVMVTKWKMSQELAEEFHLYFGGDIDLCKRAVEQLIRNGDNFDPITDVFNSGGLSMCANNPAARKHLQNMADQGWSPVKNLDEDAAAELIARKNVGGVLPKTAQIFDRPKDMFMDEHEYALVPAGTLMRRKIAKALELPLDTRNSDLNIVRIDKQSPSEHLHKL